MLVIRLARVGKRKQPKYRMVVADKRRAATGRFLEVVGRYDPLTDPATVEIDQAKVQTWIGKGAQPSETVRSLLTHAEKGEAITNKPKNKKARDEKAAPASEPAAAAETPSAEVTSETTKEAEAPITPEEAPDEAVVRDGKPAPEPETADKPEVKSTQPEETPEAGDKSETETIAKEVTNDADSAPVADAPAPADEAKKEE